MTEPDRADPHTRPPASPQHHDRHDNEGHHDHDDPALGEILDLDGQVLQAYWADVLGTVRRAAASTERRRVVDLGAGTGTGSIGLAQLFPGAEVVALDSSERMLARVRDKALSVGLSSRVRTVQADLDLSWPDLGPVDVTWASFSLHHLTDPDRVLRDVFAATRPGGLLAVAEMVEPLRFLPRDVGVGRPGLEERCLAVLARQQSHRLPELGSDWSPRLAATGFTVLSDRTLSITVDAPGSPAALRYARLWLQRLRSGLADDLLPDDLEALDVLVNGSGPTSAGGGVALEIRGTRTLTVAQRP